MSEDHMDEFEHYNFDQDKHVNMSGHSGKLFIPSSKKYWGGLYPSPSLALKFAKMAPIGPILTRLGMQVAGSLGC